jgi:hypothetical protein
MKLYITIFIYLLFSTFLSAQKDEWIVRFDEQPLIENLKNTSSDIISVQNLSDALDIYLFKFGTQLSSDEVEKKLSHLNHIRHITPNMEVEQRRLPNDPLYSDQYYLDLIQAERAWDETTGKTNDDNDYVIALLDDGFDTRHPDISRNIWANQGEIPDDGIDNDSNGFIDDYLGLNIEDNNDKHNVAEHGTQVLGILGADGDNGEGISGVMWDANILLISNVSNVGEIIAGLDYLYEMKLLYMSSNGEQGANVIINNFSGGLSRFFPSDFPDWCAMYDLLGTVGILSVGSVANSNFNVETEGDLPTLCTSPFLITVTNTDRNDVRSSLAAFGATSVDLAAPGENILSTGLNNEYIEFFGTSASAPQIAGAIGLMYNVDCDAIQELHNSNPSQLALTMKNALLDGVDQLPSMNESVSGGRLNLFNSMLELGVICGSSEIDELSIADISPNPISVSSINSVSLEYVTDVFTEHTLLINDQLGRLVYYQKFTPPTFGEKQLLLNQIPVLSPGIYSFSIMNENDIASTSVVIIE